MSLLFLCTFQTVIVNFKVYLLKTLVGVTFEFSAVRQFSRNLEGFFLKSSKFNI